eukprot:TRINITY_DN7474_c0_g1_i1.p1 TRINITY_DN7474_c0_g1~~TRINITY_DN7474_c0_g1_i1.p1  ORF type:complete len:475 (+),score=123.32 TRINITY_DN7474_c0_g1_i1:21-1445(+)
MQQAISHNNNNFLNNTILMNNTNNNQIHLNHSNNKLNNSNNNNILLNKSEDKILIENDVHTKKVRIEKYFKEIDLGGYTLFIAPILKEEGDEENITTKNLARIIKNEYQEICSKSPFTVNEMSFSEKEKNYPTSCTYSNYNKNRYKDVLCAEKTRFKYLKSKYAKNNIEDNYFSLKIDEHDDDDEGDGSYDSDNNDNYIIFDDSRPKQQNFKIIENKEPPIKEEDDLIYDDIDGEEYLEEEDTSKYINANYIRGNIEENSVFISTQAPLEDTLDDFYEMIWQAKSKIVISLSSLIENNKSKMFQFWPEKDKLINTKNYKISIKDEFSERKDIYIRILQVTSSHNKSRDIIQMHYTGWPDNEAPKDPSNVIEIYKLQRKYEEEGKKEGLSGPIIVHCSAGIGRTATYVAFVFGSQVIEKEKTVSYPFDRAHIIQKIDLPSLLLSIREQRHGSVQTWQQYTFVYKALNYYIKNCVK